MRCFIILNFFAIFFGIFLLRLGKYRIRDLNFFSLFLSLSHPILAKNNAGKRFFNFLNFFRNFSCTGRVLTEFGTKIFFSFLAHLIPFWLKLIPERGFLIFLIFWPFLSEFSCPALVLTEFWTKFFYSLSQPPSTQFR